MSAQRLSSMLNPETIAFVGASEDSARFVSIHENVTSYEDDRSRDHYYVNPNRESVFGHPCHDSITDIDATVDLAVLITPASVVPQVFEECCTAGVGAAIVVSAGFAEAGEEGRKRNERLVELSEAHDLPFCGPNTYGVLSTHDRLAAIQASSLDATTGNVAAVLQSGGLLNQVIYSSIERGIGLSTVVDSGNEASVGASEYFEYLLEDDRTDVILGVLEGITDPERFLTVAERALERETPIVVLKLARSAKGGEIARSHTGAITTPDDVVTAAFRQYGVVQVPSLDLLIDAAALFSRRQRISGPNVGVVEISGGGCALFSDAVAETDLSLPELSPETHAAVDPHVPDIGATRNPVDLAMGWGSSEMDRAYPAVLDAFADDPAIDVVVSRLSVPRTGEASTAKRRLAQLAERASGDATEGTAFAIVSRTSGGVSEDWIAAVADAGVPFLQGYHKGTEALALLAGYSAALDRRAERDRSPPSVTPIDRDPGLVGEHEAKRLLAERGFPTTTERLATSREEAVDAAADIGFPVCLKVASTDVPHKSDVGGVVTDISDAAGVRHAYDEIRRAVTDRRPDAHVDGILVQEMVEGGVELLVGSKSTPFGPTVVVGMGGVFAEVLGDAAMRIAPVSEAEAERMLRELAGYEALEGTRGDSAVSIPTLTSLVSRFAGLVAASDGIAEADLNPVIATEDGVVVVDALFRF